MAGPTKQALTAVGGDDFHFSFRLAKDGAPLPMQGMVGVAELRFELADPAVASTMQVTLEPLVGRVRLFMDHLETLRLGALPDVNLVYSVRLQNADGTERRTWLTGAFKIQTVSTR